MISTRKVYNKILKETNDEAENMPYALVKLYMKEYGKQVIEECAKVQHEAPLGHKYDKVMELKNQIK